MPTAEEAEAAERSEGTSLTFPPSSLPWQQIPKFEPGITELRSYEKKLSFLRDIWPQEHIAHLATRAALQVEGAAFAKVAQLDTKKLQTYAGVEYLVGALGGQWGRLADEDRYELFEKAIYQTQQKSDESNDSFLNRHDAVWDDLHGKKVSLEEVRAYCLIRQSALSSEDRKRLIVDGRGTLDYAKAREGLRLLGARFFQDLSNSGKSNNRNKTYDVNVAHDQEDVGPSGESINYQQEEAWECSDEDVLFALYDAGDEDAAFILDFEDQILATIQESESLAPIFQTYQIARAQLREKARSRGFWPMTTGKGKGKNKGKKGKMPQQVWNQRRRSLADRIANSTCKICDMPGHWKRECPWKGKGTSKGSAATENETISMTYMQDAILPEDDTNTELIEEIPQDATPWGGSTETWHCSVGFLASEVGKEDMQECFGVWDVVFLQGNKNQFSHQLQKKLVQCCRKHKIALPASLADTDPNINRDPVLFEIDPRCIEECHVVADEEGPEQAIIDTGASRTIIGEDRVAGLMGSFSQKVREGVLRTKSKVTFKFGNSGTLQSSHALLFPRAKAGWIRVEVVPGRTPFLISNALLKKLGAVIDVGESCMYLKGVNKNILLKSCRKNLSCCKFEQLLQQDSPAEADTLMTEKHATDQHHQATLEFKQETQARHDFEKQETCVMHSALHETAMNIQPAFEIKSDSHQGPESCHPEGERSSHAPTSKLLGGRTHSRSRPAPQDSADIPRCSSQRIPATPRHHEPGNVGRGKDPIWEACRKELSSSDRERARIRQSDLESSSSLYVGAQLPELLSSISTSRSSGSKEPIHELSKEATNGSHAKDETNPIQCEPFAQRGEGKSASGRRSSERPKESTGSRTWVPQRVDSDRSQGGTQKWYLNEAPQLSRKEQSFHEDREQSRQDPRVASSNCHSATGIEQRASGSRIKSGVKEETNLDSMVAYIEDLSQLPYVQLSKNEESQLILAIEKFVSEIEDGLSTNSPLSSSSRFSRPKFEKSNRSRPVDLLEVYCEEDSQIAKQINRQGGLALRFTKGDGDLSTREGQNKLWLWIHIYEPRHIWMAPECKLYGSFSNFNMQRSVAAMDEMYQKRQNNVVHLELCNEIYLHQVTQGNHVHLEQPSHSCMLKQQELFDLATGTLPAHFDMCTAGKLHLPQSEKFLKKATVVYTTSRHMHEQLHRQNCQHQHEHQSIQGKLKYKHKTMNISAYAAAYTAAFGRQVATAVFKDVVKPQYPLLMDEILVGIHEKPEMAREVLQDQKRRRYSEKGPPQDIDKGEPSSSSKGVFGKAPSWSQVMKDVSKETPRVGNMVFREEHPLFQIVQRLVPELEIRLMLGCRGTERLRTPGGHGRGDDMPWRKTVFIHMNTGEIVDDGELENWSRLPKTRQNGKCGPAKLSLTIFGVKQESNIPKECQPEEIGPSNSSPGTVSRRAGGPFPEEVDVERKPQTEFDLDGPLKERQSGPAFRQLSLQQQTDLRRLHINLGHPDPDRLVKFLQSQNAEESVIQGARDMQCDACSETVAQPKLPHPSGIHEPRDFNDLVGGDGAYWTNDKGRRFHFMHFIDESTLFHVGGVSGRSVEEQIETFERIWLTWAGPPKRMYLDPAGEYTNPKWHDFLQQEGTKLSVAAAESHWQIGRCEAHGRVIIIKNMLNKMNSEEPILSDEDFRRSLRHAFAAKNALSRVRGFSPEQCLLGKARALPASITGDDEATSHALADTELPEGLRFRADLQRREQARKAFVEADNDCAARRALLRRSRPGKFEFEPRDWVLYWRQAKGNSMGDRGRWHGPGQVIQVEGSKVIWISHGGYLIRASPEQVRPVSLREYAQLKRNADGTVQSEAISSSARNFRDLTAEGSPVNPELEEGEVGNRVEVEERSRRESSVGQPEAELFPQDKGSDSYSPSIPESITPEVPTTDGTAVPVPSDDDELFAFGDDLECDKGYEGFWEICLGDFENKEVSECELCCESEVVEWSLLTTGARKQRNEVQWKTLTAKEQELFKKAKQKEVGAWLEHGTIKKVAGKTLRPDQIMRCRWILTWKPPAPGTTEKRAKARLVILGFEDPGISSVPSDAPTLSKDGKQLLLQQVASRKWKLINFDISTAFLKGAGDGRQLGIHAPDEIKAALGMNPTEQCQLIGGAYGRVDAPILWYRTLRATMEDLGFVPSPLDGCVFSLVTADENGQPQVRGVLGVHVDDGLGGGDEFFHKVLARLRAKYEFGAYNEGSFEFCGVRYFQWDDYSIEMGQDEYIQRIAPVQIPRDRRQDPKAELSETEKQMLRQICGSLQYAAVQTRPDIAAKVGSLQASIPHARIEHLIDANRVLYEAKTKPVTLLIAPIPEPEVTFCAFSNASFETQKGNPSRQGTVIFSTNGKMAQNELAVVCPMAWSSKKIPRVVKSTLSAEAIALGSTIDRLSWIRLFWAWLKDPSIDWYDPTAVLTEQPLATVATDCKSVFDLATKTAPPACAEFRTTLECLQIRERLKEHSRLRWVSSAAQLADCLTKVMDGSALRKALEVGRYSLFDEDRILANRANKRAQISWINRASKGTEAEATNFSLFKKGRV